jgi:hypothetical protein
MLVIRFLVASPYSGGDMPPPPPPPPDISSFFSQVSSLSKTTKPPPSRFMKKLDEILKVLVHPSNSCSLSLWLLENALI